MVEGNDSEELVKLILLFLGVIILLTILRNGMTWFAGCLLSLMAVLSSIYIIGMFIMVLKKSKYSNTRLFELNGTVGDVLNAIFWWGIPLIILIFLIFLYITIDIFHTEINFYIFPITFISILSPIGFAWLVVWIKYNIEEEGLWISIMCFFVIVILSSITFEEYVNKLYLPSHEYDSLISITLLIITLLTALLSYGITYVLIEKNWISSENDY